VRQRVSPPLRVLGAEYNITLSRTRYLILHLGDSLIWRMAGPAPACSRRARQSFFIILLFTRRAHCNTPASRSPASHLCITCVRKCSGLGISLLRALAPVAPCLFVTGYKHLFTLRRRTFDIAPRRCCAACRIFSAALTVSLTRIAHTHRSTHLISLSSPSLSSASAASSHLALTLWCASSYHPHCLLSCALRTDKSAS